MGLYAVADGHGKEGGRIARSALKILLDIGDYSVDVKTMIQEQFRLADHQLKKELSGTTASLVVRQENAITIGYVGDSEVRLVQKDGHLSTLTIPHQYGVHRGETRRLNEQGVAISGGSVDDFGRYKKGSIVSGHQTLEPTRVLGDVAFTGLVSPEPEIVEATITSQDRFLLIATDGLWKKINDLSKRRKVEKIFADARDLHEAKDLLMAQLQRWKLSDNTTVILVEL